MADIAETQGAPSRARTAPPNTREAWNAGAGFYLVMAIVSTVLVFIGFAPSFYLKSVIHAPTPGLTFLTMTHGLVFTAWMLLFVTQAALIATGRPAPHRQLGILGGMLFGAMISLGFSTAITAARLGHTPPEAPPALAFMALPFIALTAVAGLVAAALLNRRNPDWHKRLMLASVFIMTGPGTGRIAVPIGMAAQGTNISLGVADLLLAIAILNDLRTSRRVHPAYIASAVVFAVINVAILWAMTSPPAWIAFAKAVTQTG